MFGVGTAATQRNQREGEKTSSFEHPEEKEEKHKEKAQALTFHSVSRI